ncbi:MAG: 50S ribosomal protein L23 [Deltaproteobacteria bacterium CG_4_8_14_3_um_filter_45_9]|jgi:large subunit ribosomal protein L23|nr:MAG: 50S ribosomal protein L23 [Deltaproteobacteria bacterium CG03_land_8_20_14_0_80_45_14]PIX25203.1 MAG: 50S ribosomal protein L23 [Deltaproteobacteria bacterium CG_4_8_14_3_um_filter_45_9]
MKEAQKIIRRPLITEKSTRQKEENRQYIFEVHRDANKIEIQSAVERLFKVNVLQVRTSNVMGKIKRLGRRYGKRPDWKKAIITLKEGDRIDFFEGA